MSDLERFELAEQMRSSRDNSEVEDENDEPEEEQDEEPRELPDAPVSGLRIDTEARRCSCGAPLCFTCGWCSAECLCPEKKRL